MMGLLRVFIFPSLSQFDHAASAFLYNASRETDGNETQLIEIICVKWKRAFLTRNVNLQLECVRADV